MLGVNRGGVFFVNLAAKPFWHIIRKFTATHTHSMNIFDSNFAINSDIDEETDFIPLLSTEDEENMNAENVPQELPILPLRNTVLFPGVVIPITVGRDKSINLIKEANKGNKTIGVISQTNDTIEDPQIKDLNAVGTVAYIVKMLRMPDGSTTVIMQGKRRFKIVEFTQTDPYFKAKTVAFNEDKPAKNDKEFEALVSSL